MPAFGDGSALVGLNHPALTSVARGDAVPVEEAFQVGKQQDALGRNRSGAAVDGVQAPAELHRRQPRQAQRTPAQLTVPVASVVDGVEDHARRTIFLRTGPVPTPSRRWHTSADLGVSARTIPGRRRSSLVYPLDLLSSGGRSFDGRYAWTT